MAAGVQERIEELDLPLRPGWRREMGLGSCITVDLALAREKARECRLLRLDKRDPLEERDRARAEHAQRQAKRVSFDKCAASYIDPHRGSWKSARHAAQWETTLACTPVLSSARCRWPRWTRT